MSAVSIVCTLDLSNAQSADLTSIQGSLFEIRAVFVLEDSFAKSFNIQRREKNIVTTERDTLWVLSW